MTDRLPESTLRVGLPSGSMQQSTIELFGRAGYRVALDSRSVFPRFDDEKISSVLFRAQEISRYVASFVLPLARSRPFAFRRGALPKVNTPYDGVWPRNDKSPRR